MFTMTAMTASRRSPGTRPRPVKIRYMITGMATPKIT